MRPFPSNGRGSAIHPDEAIRPFLERQFGLVTLEQARRSGVSRGALVHRVRTGRLRRVYRGVYAERAVGGSLEQDVLAACLACGAAARASHGSAAMLLGLIDRAPHAVHVVVPPTARPRLRAATVHRARLVPADRSRLGVIPVTGIPRTLVDLAGALEERDLAEAADVALRRGLVSPAALDRVVRGSRFDRARGIATVRQITQDRGNQGVPGSRLEADAIATLRRFGLPQPKRQFEARVRGRKVVFDLCYPDRHLAIELDGRMPHREFETWQRDHRRHNATELGPFRTLRFTWWDIHETPVYFAATVADGLGLRPARWA